MLAELVANAKFALGRYLNPPKINHIFLNEYSIMNKVLVKNKFEITHYFGSIGNFVLFESLRARIVLTQFPGGMVLCRW